MGDLAADRVYDQRRARQLVFAATGIGVAVVETAGDSIGRFRLARECEARDVAGGGDRVVVATPEDVLTCAVDADGEGEWVETGFGPAVAVGVDRGDLLAAGPDGELGRVVDAGADPTDWLSVADVDGAVRAIDGPLVAASDGVYRFTADGIFDVGLDDVRDVSAAGVPLAATGDGLFRLGNGWLRELDGDVDVVAGTDRPASDARPDEGERSAADRSGDGGDIDGSDSGSGDDGVDGDGGVDGADGLARAHGATGERLYEYLGVSARERRSAAERDDGAGGAPGAEGTAGESPAGEGDADGVDEEIVSAAVAAQTWRERSTPVGPVVAVAHGQRTYALAADGTFLLDRGDEWATQVLGLPDPVALATPE